MLFGAINEIELFVYVFGTVYVIALIAYVLTSWVRLPYSLQPVHRFLYDVCEPYLRIFRRLLPSTGAIDLSPMLALIFLIVIDRFLIWVLNHFN